MVWAAVLIMGIFLLSERWFCFLVCFQVALVASAPEFAIGGPFSAEALARVGFPEERRGTW